MVAVVDSGVRAPHPHVPAVNGGVDLSGTDERLDYTDQLGHGTAVAAAIIEKAPEADLLAVKVFDRSLATTAETLARAIVWSADHGARLINLSLGTTNALRAALLREAVAHACGRGALVVSAREMDAQRWLPGSLSDVAGVQVDWECERDALVLDADTPGVFHASGYPRPIPGVPRERNLSGISFAVANTTGFLARLLQDAPEIRSLADVEHRLLAPP